MRVLLVSWSPPVGGLPNGTHALGRGLVSSGHDVVTLVGSSGRPTLRPTSGRRSRIVPGHGYPVWSSRDPELALPRLLRLFQPDVVVGSGIGRGSWRRAAALARRSGARTGLHLGPSSIQHPSADDPYDVLLADSVELADAAAASDHHAFVVPSAFEEAMASIGFGPPPRRFVPHADAPSLSVVIPAHNVEKTLGEQLDALLSQPWEREFEVIVADNRSTDGTAELVRRRMKEESRLHLVDVPAGQGASLARNAGVGAAQATSIAFCDADDVVAPGWVAAMAEALNSHQLVAGRIDVEALNPPGLARSRGLSVGRGPGRFGVVPFAHGCNIGVQRGVLDAVGGWDEATRIGEDIELCLRLWQIGVELHDEPSAVVRYRYHLDRSSQWQQAVRFGAAHVDIARRFEVRQLSRPMRLEGWRNMAWLVRHMRDLLDPERRTQWLWTAGLRFGRLRGSLQWRTMYL